MASHEREGLLPGELFRDHDGLSEDNNIHQHGFVVSPKGLRTYESNSAASFGSSSSSYSSWSDLSSPFGSELESTSETTESEDEEFISELTRRMAESMLQDDDEDEQQDIQNHDSEASELSVNLADGKPNSVCYYYNSPGFITKSETPTLESTGNVGNLRSDDNSTEEQQLGPVQVYELKNQPQLKKPGSVGGYGGKRVNKAATDSTQQLQPQKEQQNVQNRGGKAWKQQGQGKKNILPLLPSPQAGSGMRAVFLGGSERNGCTGTGVFLPSGAYTKPEPKRKSGCSTVLIPARVLQTLQQHFNTVGAASPSTPSCGGGGSPNLPWRNDVLARINGLLSQKKEHAEFQYHSQTQTPTYSAAETNHHPEVQLPQEWTY